MQRNIDEIINGFMKTINQIDRIKKYIEIFNKYPEKLKEEFRRNKRYISDEEYDKNLAELNNINIEQLKSTVNFQIENFRNMENLEKVSKQYVTFIINELTNYNWNSMTYISKYCINVLENFEMRILSNNEDTYTIKDNESIDYLYYMLKQYCIMYLKIIFDKISSIEIFKEVSCIKNNIVMIGANGSGKSTFARTLKGKIDNNITIIPTQHLLVVSKFDSIPIRENMIEKVNRYQQENKLGNDDNIVNLLSHDFEDLIKHCY